MSIPSIKAATDLVSAAPPPSRGSDAPDFAALAASLARGDLAGARAAVATATAAAAPTPRDDALHASVIDGNLAGARVMLALHGSAESQAATGTKLAGGADTRQPKRNDVDGHATGAATTPAAAPSAPAHASAPNVVDVGAVSQGETNVDVAAVLLALATGNAGNIPAEVINRYGPGGERYDPAAIMDAYRASPLGHAQMASMAWIGKPA